MAFAARNDRWPRGDSYSQWLRRVLSGAPTTGEQPCYALFDSSTAEPTKLLTGLIAEAFSPPVTPRFLSVFANGNPALVAALARRYAVDEGQILCTAGATSALGILYRAYLSPGDHVLVERPGFDLFTDIAASMGAKIDYFDRNMDDGSIDLDAVKAAIRGDTRLIVLSNLHNPTGMPLKRETLIELAALAERNGIDLLVDEVYREYAEPAPGHAATLASNILTISSLTKVWGLSSLRCGWIIADASRMEAIRAVHARLEFAPSKVTHTIAALVLENPEPFDAHWRGLLAHARPVMEEHFAAWRAAGLVEGSLPRHGCVCFPRLTGIKDTLEFSGSLAENQGVIVAPGEYFGAPGRVRIGFSSPPDALTAALDRFGKALADRRLLPQRATAVA